MNLLEESNEQTPLGPEIRTASKVDVLFCRCATVVLELILEFTLLLSSLAVSDASPPSLKPMRIESLKELRWSLTDFPPSLPATWQYSGESSSTPSLISASIPNFGFSHIFITTANQFLC
jgi:hypothetical protein